MTPTPDEIRRLLEAATKYAPAPWRHEHGKIWCQSLKGGETFIADVRGWGYLTGQGNGALNMASDEAIAIQNAWGHAFALTPTIAAAYVACQENADKLAITIRDMHAAGLALKEENARLVGERDGALREIAGLTQQRDNCDRALRAKDEGMSEMFRRCKQNCFEDLIP